MERTKSDLICQAVREQNSLLLRQAEAILAAGEVGAEVVQSVPFAELLKQLRELEAVSQPELQKPFRLFYQQLATHLRHISDLSSFVVDLVERATSEQTHDDVSEVGALCGEEPEKGDEEVEEMDKVEKVDKVSEPCEEVAVVREVNEVNGESEVSGTKETGKDLTDGDIVEPDESEEKLGYNVFRSVVNKCKKKGAFYDADRLWKMCKGASGGCTREAAFKLGGQ
eukprot:gnl/Hemi2/4717_TR1633_c1_g1_i1.p1 gnl/Hemi2/4717_TR1633_c1_g1~~gnl/Hemi2/4717_TR1633_c1_g1_i1.p1  ORF type:complete len:226 (+),score=43.59 gnl/Hemi2/4717_TR1633_c1_g1_i1:2-679(+)